MVDAEDKAHNAYLEGDYETAIQLWSSRALAGDPFAKYSLALMYEDGRGVDANLESALELYASAAADGVPQAQHNLAWIYISGKMGQSRKLDGCELLKENAERGFGVSQSDLGQMHLDGDIVLRDINLAVRYLSEAARQGITNAQNTLGQLYLRGQVVSRNLREAHRLFEMAASQNDPIGMFNLGGLYLKGEGVEKNVSEAVRLLEKSARAGLVQAQVNLGALYVNDNEVATNYETAMRWYQMAAEQGDSIGQHNLGLMYANGQGVDKDYELAAYWLTLSFLGGYEASENILTQVKAHLSRDEIAALHNKIRSASKQEERMPGNIELWQQQAAELGLNRQAQKGLLFLCGACGSIGNDKEAVNRRLNWLFPIDPLTNLEDECGGIYDGKIVSLLEEMLFHLGAQIEFREIKLGEVCIQALTPQNHGTLQQEGTHQLTMFSVNGLYSSFLEQLGTILEESDFDEEHCHLSGMFFLQVNYQTDVKGFISTFRFLEQAMSPVYRYLIDMPSIGNVDQLRGFLPFQRVLYGFISGMPQETVERLWSLQSYIFYKDDPDGELAAQFLSPNHLMERTISSIDKYIDEYSGILETLRVEEMLPQSALTIDQDVEMLTHIGRVVSQEWGGDISTHDSLNAGSKLMLNVCVFYAVTAIKVANLDAKRTLNS